MKLWVDDMRPAPIGYRWIRTTEEAIQAIQNYALMKEKSGGKAYYQIELIDLDHDAGEYARFGGDYIEILNWLEAKAHIEGCEVPPIRIHSMNPVDRGNMRQIIRKNGWKEID